MKNWLITVVKYYKGIYRLWCCIGNGILKILQIFVKPDDRLILFTSLGGRKYDDSPRAIYEAMREDERFRDFKKVWAFRYPKNFDVPGAEVITIDTLQYYITALKARCWITNAGIQRDLSFKRKQTFYLNTWHGTAIKKMGLDKKDLYIPKKEKTLSEAKNNPVIDIMLSQGDYDVDIFSRAYLMPRERFLKCGLPRNDRLASYSMEERDKLKKALNLPLDKKIILYAPTFRDYERDAMRNHILAPPIHLNQWEQALANDYCLLVRAHYEVAKILNITENAFVRNVSDYPELNDLMIAADILISDYSSIFFDFSIMDKVMLHFTYDYDTYLEQRGMYFDIRKELSGADKEEELLTLLTSLNEQKEIERTVQFRNRYVNYYGTAVKQSLDCIASHICGDDEKKWRIE